MPSNTVNGNTAAVPLPKPAPAEVVQVSKGTLYLLTSFALVILAVVSATLAIAVDTNDQVGKLKLGNAVLSSTSSSYSSSPSSSPSSYTPAATPATTKYGSSSPSSPYGSSSPSSPSSSPTKTPPSTSTVNPCNGKKPKDASPGDGYFNNVPCLVDGVKQSLEQSGTNVTKGYKGEIDTHGRMPITSTYKLAGLCPVNVHWHLGAEHLSVGEYDENGKGPLMYRKARRSLNAAAGASVRQGFQCHVYDKSDEKYTKPYAWKHCVGMQVGQTYEIHWPHSAAGMCGSDWQMQTPFYDGVFCKDGVISLSPLNTFQKIGVQAQVYTIVNDETYYNDNLLNGWIEYPDMDVAKYTGSTTGTTRSNEICSRFTPITWQVDRKCHMVSASSMDKLCEDMKAQKADMSDDLHAHGARELVADQFAADNHQRLH